MHDASMASMKRCIDRHDPYALADGPIKVLDVGSMDVNGSYRQLFDAERSSYTGVDLADGNGVDLVLETPYTLPFDTGHFDVVVSGQMLEHNEFFWLTFQEMMRVLKPEGLCFVIAPSRGEIHRYPWDCYRFYPDGYRALAKFTDSQIIDCWMETENEWGDLTGVFRKRKVKDADQFDTHSITTIGGPATQLMELAVRLDNAQKRLAAANAKLRAYETSSD